MLGDANTFGGDDISSSGSSKSNGTPDSEKKLAAVDKDEEEDVGDWEMDPQFTEYVSARCL